MLQTADIELLRDLVAMRAVSADVAAVNRSVDRMKKHLEGHGLHLVVEEVDGRKVLYASSRKGRKPALLLNAHLDVVPAIDEDQYELAEPEAGWLGGRGTGDCLGNAVIAARVLIDHAKEYDIGAIFNSDEEIGGRTARAMVERGYGARRAILVIDSGYGCVVIGHKGALVLKVTAHGKGGHSAHPAALDNPIDKLVTGYRRLLRSWRNPSSDRDWRDSMEACIIGGGTTKNQVPDTAELTLNFRYIRDSHRDRIIERVRRATGCEVSVLSDTPPVNISPKYPELVTLRKIMARNLPDCQVEFTRTCGTTDGRHFAACKVPLAMIGTKDRGVHGRREAVNVAALEAVGRILVEFGAAVAAD